MNSTGTIQNNGTINSSGGGGITFTGASGIIEGTGAYSNIIIALTNTANNVVVNPSNVTFTGQLVLNKGGIDVTANDLSPSGSSATIVRNLAIATTDITTAGVGTFIAAAVQYNLTYTGKLTGNTTSGSEFTSGTVRDLEVNVDADDGGGGPFTLSLSGGVNKIKGDLTVAQNALFDFATSLELDKDGASATINGSVVGS